MSDRKKLLKAVQHIRAYCAEHEIVGSMTLIGREGMAENHLMFDAPWCKIILQSVGTDSMGLRYMATKTDSRRDIADTCGALAVLAGLMGETAISLLDASRIIDREVGASHTAIRKDDDKPA